MISNCPKPRVRVPILCYLQLPLPSTCLSALLAAYFLNRCCSQFIRLQNCNPALQCPELSQRFASTRYITFYTASSFIQASLSRGSDSTPTFAARNLTISYSDILNFTLISNTLDFSTPSKTYARVVPNTSVPLLLPLWRESARVCRQYSSHHSHSRASAVATKRKPVKEGERSLFLVA